MEEDVKMLLFGRWMAMNYATKELNGENSYWWKDQLDHFNKIVYPNYIKNGTVEKHIEVLTNKDIIKGVINDLP